MTSIGYCALIRLALFEKISEPQHSFVDCLLSAEEKALLARCVTNKRRTEFLGGRFAGKLAASVCRLAAGFDLLAWNDIGIYPVDNGAPVCRHADEFYNAISISHTKHFALAVASLNRCQVGVDIEEDNPHVYPLTEMFSEIELSQINDPLSARLRWTLKEMYGKLMGIGILGYTHSLLTHSHENNLWLRVPATTLPAKPINLATGCWGELAVSIGFAGCCS